MCKDSNDTVARQSVSFNPGPRAGAALERAAIVRRAQAHERAAGEPSASERSGPAEGEGLGCAAQNLSKSNQNLIKFCQNFHKILHPI